MLGRYGLFSGDVSRLSLVLLGGVVLYFAWMDLILYNRIQSLRPLRLLPLPLQNGSSHHGVSGSAAEQASQPLGGLSVDTSPHSLEALKYTTQTNQQDTSIYSPFHGLSVKLMMMDHLNHYLENPVALALTKVFLMDSRFLWITPNMLSFLGMMLAFLAGRCISWDGRCWHLTAVGLMLGRGLMDAMDGFAARERQGITQHISLHNTAGFFVDAICDTLGYTVFLIGCFVYLKNSVPKQYQSLPVLYQGDDKPKRKSEALGTSPYNGAQWTSQRIFLVVFCLGMQIAISSGLWDHYCTSYHLLLETPRASESQAIVQNEALKSTLTFLVIWLWRISNSHALLNWLLFAILLNKMWEFLTFIQFIGFAEVATLFVFTEIHIRDVTAYVNMVP